jgi:hypothetical protein
MKSNFDQKNAEVGLAGHPVKICHHASPSCGYPLIFSSGRPFLGLRKENSPWHIAVIGAARMALRAQGVFQGFLASPDCLTAHQVPFPFNAAIVSLVTIELTALAKSYCFFATGLTEIHS